MTAAQRLRQPLERLYREFDYGTRVELDAIRFPLRYAAPRDRELVGLLTACLAYGRVDLWQVNLFALSAAGTATKLTLRRRWTVGSQHVAVDPTLLVPATAYIVQIVGYQGFPGAGAGDFRTQSFPWASSQQWSGIFGVGN